MKIKMTVKKEITNGRLDRRVKMIIDGKEASHYALVKKMKGRFTNYYLIHFYSIHSFEVLRAFDKQTTSYDHAMIMAKEGLKDFYC